jgi:ABC-type Fe3+/spermidine/putrescine transport system ATPase subunit
MHAGMAADPLWQLDAVSLGKVRLHEVSVAIRTGVTAIVGWSGAGKTSLLNLLAGFERPDSGTLTGAKRRAPARTLRGRAIAPFGRSRARCPG